MFFLRGNLSDETERIYLVAPFINNYFQLVTIYRINVCIPVFRANLY